MATFYSSVSDSDVESNENLIAKSEKITYSPGRKGKSAIYVALHGAFLLLNIIILGSIFRGNPVEFRELEQSLAAESIKWESKYFEYNHHSPYFGTPKDSVYSAWRDLKRYSNIVVPESYMQKLNRTEEGVRLPDGSGYLATLNVHHELHCVEQMYRWINMDVYFPNITATEIKDQRSHLYHCLEGLRQSVICGADLSIVTMRWGAKQATPLANWQSSHTCKNWDSVEKWAREHEASSRMTEPGWLNHPYLGWAFANTSRLGVVHDHPLLGN